MALIALFKVIASIYLQCATKLMISKKVVKKKYENELINQSLIIERNGARLSFNCVKTVIENFESLALKKILVYQKVRCTFL